MDNLKMTNLIDILACLAITGETFRTIAALVRSASSPNIMAQHFRKTRIPVTATCHKKRKSARIHRISSSFTDFPWKNILKRSS